MKHILTVLCMIAVFWPMNALPQNRTPSVEPQEWVAYKARFVREDGRVVDDANGDISHSEGQGYGLLLAWLADDRAGFEHIWSFTRTRLMLRDDGLAVWKWDPAATPPVTDPNNASDGDLLIAYALALAGRGWSEQRFVDSARQIAEALAAHAIYDFDGRTLLRPGAVGFDAADRPDGPVVNLSYWIFEALPVMAELAPEAGWESLGQSGVELVRAAAFGDRKLPPDWLAIGDTPKPAEGFPAEFSYNALRIPLYLMRAQDGDMELLRRLRDGIAGANGGVALVDLETGAVKEELMDAGYRIIQAFAGCVLDGTTLPEDLRLFEPTVYYPSTLHLLSLAGIREAHPQCL